MNISYSYYNTESENNCFNNYSDNYSDNYLDNYLIDDDLYQLAVNVNNKNAQQENNKNSKLDKSVYNNIHKNNSSQSKYPYYNMQGQYFEDSENISFSDLSIEQSSDSEMSELKYKRNKKKCNKDIDFDEKKIDHIKSCNHCKKIFLDIVKNRNNKHVFDEHNNLIPLQTFDQSQIAQKLQLQQLQQIQDLQRMQYNLQKDNYRIDTLQTNQPISNIFSKEVILVILIGLAIILILDILSTRGRRR